MFIDRAVINVYGGPGGAGAEAFLRQRGRPRGGPSGGDGGDGGDVVLVADPQLSTLLDLRYRQHYRAERGYHGEGNRRTGSSGATVELRVPPGTLARDADTGELLGELMAAGDRLLVARGGRGGKGNAHFATPTRQAPRGWDPGQPGEERRVALELKLIADVGLVGQPNAGKSTLLAALSEARPKIADYPFTTLEPHLGVVSLTGYRSFVLADIPGIIEGAHEGKGLGHQFLRHVERTGALAFVIPATEPDPGAVLATLRSELAEHSDVFADRPYCVVISKTDLLGPDQNASARAVSVPGGGEPEPWGVFSVSAVTGSGLDELREGLWTSVDRSDPGEESPSPTPDRAAAEGPPSEDDEWWAEDWLEP